MSALPGAALEYAGIGLPVLPCWWTTPDGRCACGAASGNCKPGKHPLGPLVPNGLKNATTSPSTIRAWWLRSPKANVAIATGGAFAALVVDVDPDKGGEASMAKLEAEHGSMPETVEAITPRGGRHLYFKVPLDRPVPGNTTSGLGPGIDTRGQGGYVVAPPSIIGASGYTWSVDSADSFALAPAWLLDKLGPAAGGGQARPSADWIKMLTEGVDDGARNNKMASLAGHLLRYLPDPMVAAQLVACFNKTCCRPPLPDAVVERTLGSIYKAEMKRRGHVDDE